MKHGLVVLGLLGFALVPSWTLQTTGVNARLRGVSAVDERVAWLAHQRWRTDVASV